MNPFALQKKESSGTLVEAERAIQEIQAAMIIAKRFPRDQHDAMDRILQTCTRPTLAQQALYAYPRGGIVVSDASIRLAEAIAQNWGNMQFGIRELDQADGVSTVQAFAWDVETNTRQVKEFQVRHERKAHGSIKKLDDPRDVYEMVANQGARRMRACILSVIPGDVIEAAKKQCELTLQNLEGAPSDQIKSLAEAFEEIGVTRQQLEKRLGHRLGVTISAEVIQMRKIYRSIKDGMSNVDEWFGDTQGAKSESDVTQSIRQQAAEQSSEWPQEIDGEIVDCDMVIYDERIHSGARTCTNTGHWRRRRGVSDEVVKKLERRVSDEEPAIEDDSLFEEEAEIPEAFSEAWFNVGISDCETEMQLAEYEEVLADAGFDQKQAAGIMTKIAARRAEIRAMGEN